MFQAELIDDEARKILDQYPDPSEDNSGDIKIDNAIPTLNILLKKFYLDSVKPYEDSIWDARVPGTLEFLYHSSTVIALINEVASTPYQALYLYTGEKEVPAVKKIKHPEGVSYEDSYLQPDSLFPLKETDRNYKFHKPSSDNSHIERNAELMRRLVGSPPVYLGHKEAQISYFNLSRAIFYNGELRIIENRLPTQLGNLAIGELNAAYPRGI